MLADGAAQLAARRRTAGRTHEVPDRSMLIVRASGAGAAAVAGGRGRAMGNREKFEARRRPTPAMCPSSSSRCARRAPSRSKPAACRRKLAVPGDPRPPPKISLTKEPERTPRGGLKLVFKVEDDYGVVSAEARIRRLAPKEDKTHDGLGPAREEGRASALRASAGAGAAAAARLSQAGRRHRFHEIGDHPWAGMQVELTADRQGPRRPKRPQRSVELVLPERRFTKPLARAVVEQRRRLAEDPRDRLQVARAIEALTLEPEEFIEDLQVYLGLRSVYWRLQRDSTRAARNSIFAQLWHIALRIEDGNLTDAERALRAAQERLSKALEEGATDEEIQRLMQELRQALAQFLEQLRQQAEGQPPMQGTDRNTS